MKGDPILAALGEAVRSDPTDRTRWLVLADLLSSRGDRRAEWVHQALDGGPLPSDLAPMLDGLHRNLLGWIDGVRRGVGLLRTGPADQVDALRALVDQPPGWSFVLLDRVVPPVPTPQDESPRELWPRGSPLPGMLRTPGPSTLASLCHAVVAAVVARITRAFDGVPPPDEHHRTLYQAQAADNYADCDRSRDHLGRWQDLPHAHLVENQWALSHLDDQGIRYYLPAVMCAELQGYLHWWSGGTLDGLWIYESLSYTLQPGPTSHLREHARRRMSLLDSEQRAAICAFALVTYNEEAFDAWLRADRDGPAPDWFDRFWPQ